LFGVAYNVEISFHHEVLIIRPSDHPGQKTTDDKGDHYQ